jgi:hypothetical protein
MQEFTLDELQNIREALDEKIHALVTKGTTNNPYTKAHALALTRDKIQAEIDKRQKD